MGNALSIDVQAQPAELVVVLASGLGWSTPLFLPGWGSYLMGCCPITLLAGVGAQHLSARVPDDPLLLGFVLPAQAWVGSGFSNFDFALIRP